jgi:hypothetical protein
MVFSWISLPPAPEYLIRTVSNFSKICGDIASQGAPPVSTTPAENFATSFTIVVDTDGKFGHRFRYCCWYLATGVNDTGGKFAAGVNDTGGNLPPVSTELRKSPRIFEKIRNGPNGILRGLGETDSWKQQK